MVKNTLNKDGLIDLNNAEDVLDRKLRVRDWEQELAIRMMLEIGCTVPELLSIRYENIKLKENLTKNYWAFHIGDSDSKREAYVPDELLTEIHKYASERNIQDDEAYIQHSEDTVRGWVSELCEEIAEETGEDRWNQISASDLKKSWLNYQLNDKDRDLHVIKYLGGCTNPELDPYLDKPDPKKIAEVMISD